MHKLQHAIRFPVDGLDMTRYVHPESAQAKTAKAYDLYAIVNQKGSLNQGHYFSYSSVVSLNLQDLQKPL